MSQLGRICIDICVIARNLSFSSFRRRFMDPNRRIKTLVMVLFPTKVVGHRYFLLALSTFVYLSPIHVMPVIKKTYSPPLISHSLTRPAKYTMAVSGQWFIKANKPSTFVLLQYEVCWIENRDFHLTTRERNVSVRLSRVSFKPDDKCAVDNQNRSILFISNRKYYLKNQNWWIELLNSHKYILIIKTRMRFLLMFCVVNDLSSPSAWFIRYCRTPKHFLNPSINSRRRVHLRQVGGFKDPMPLKWFMSVWTFRS